MPSDFLLCSARIYVKKIIMRIVTIGFLSCLLFSGCVKTKSNQPSKPTQAEAEADAAPVIVDIGKVAKVNSTARFVVMTFPLGAVPAMDRRLTVYRKGVKVAEIKVTGPERDSNTVGDIISGEVEVNDEVRVNLK